MVFSTIRFFFDHPIFNRIIYWLINIFKEYDSSYIIYAKIIKMEREKDKIVSLFFKIITW